jgi:chromosome segregation ATPase
MTTDYDVRLGETQEKMDAIEEEIEDLEEQLETEMADFVFLLHKRKSLQGQGKDWTRQKKAADVQLSRRAQWIDFLRERHDRLENLRKRSGGSEGEKQMQARRLWKRAQDKARKWSAEHAAVQLEVNEFVQRMEEANSAKAKQEVVVDDLQAGVN